MKRQVIERRRRREIEREKLADKETVRRELIAGIFKNRCPC